MDVRGRRQGGQDGRRGRSIDRSVARECLEAGLLDEIIVHVAPVLVGDGVRLFERTGSGPVRLESISSVAEGETTVLRYSVQKPGADAEPPDA